MQWSWKVVNRKGLHWTRGSQTNFKVKGSSRESLLERENTRVEQKKSFNLTYYPVFQNVKKILPELDIRGKKLPREVCKSVNGTSHFKRRDTNETLSIIKGPLDCSSNHVIYWFECIQCWYRFPYLGSSTKTNFRYWINNCKPTLRKFRNKYVEKDLALVIKKSELKLKLFHEHYCSEGHQGIENWSVTLID